VTRVPSTPFDPAAVRAKYLAERDRRLVPGRADTLDLDGDDRFAGLRDDPFTPVADRDPVVGDVEVVIVGGGIAGLLVAVELRKAGIEDVRIVDRAGGVGGTWYWNRYPGVMCDVESTIYLPMLEELGVVPTERYASGSEILAHLQAIADRYALTDGALFHTGITSATWDDGAGRWDVRTDRGDRLAARYYVLAVGILNLLKLPAIPGIEEFAGHAFHSARWDYEYTGGAPGEPLTRLRDRRVGVVGTGATGIQLVRALADAAESVVVFQRTPSAIGVRGNRPIDPHFADDLPPGWQQERMDNFQAVMLGRTSDDLIDDGWTHDYAAVQNPRKRPDESFGDFMRRAEEIDYSIMEAHRARVDDVVADPATAGVLKPYYRYLCKRPCFHDDYLSTFNERNVTLVGCPAGFERITERGPVVDGVQYDLDCLIYATGFEAELTPLYRRAGHGIVGRDGTTLADHWADGASSLYGMMIHGFPNLFAMPAPGQQAVVTVNYTHLAVLGAQFVGRTIAALSAASATRFEVTAEAEASWTEEIASTFVDGSAVMSACTPSRINLEGHPELLNPRNGNYGRGFGDYFAYRDLLLRWLDDGTFEGLDVR